VTWRSALLSRKGQHPDSHPNVVSSTACVFVSQNAGRCFSTLAESLTTQFLELSLRRRPTFLFRDHHVVGVRHRQLMFPDARASTTPIAFATTVTLGITRIHPVVTPVVTRLFRLPPRRCRRVVTLAWIPLEKQHSRPGWKWVRRLLASGRGGGGRAVPSSNNTSNGTKRFRSSSPSTTRTEQAFLEVRDATITANTTPAPSGHSSTPVALLHLCPGVYPGFVERTISRLGTIHEAGVRGRVRKTLQSS
jgi:hypothetical protein